MRYLLFVISLSFIAFNTTSAEQTEQVQTILIRPGDSYDSVLSQLGFPTGLAERGKKKIAVFPGREITFIDNKVSKVRLTTRQNNRIYQPTPVALPQENKNQVAAPDDRRRIKEGLQIKKDRLNDSRFLSLPGEQQLNFWRSFMSSYPEIDVSEQITASVNAYQLNIKANEQKYKIAKLKQKLQETADRAQKAEREANLIQQAQFQNKYANPHPTYNLINQLECRDTYSGPYNYHYYNRYRHYPHHNPKYTHLYYRHNLCSPFSPYNTRISTSLSPCKVYYYGDGR